MANHDIPLHTIRCYIRYPRLESNICQLKYYCNESGQGKLVGIHLPVIIRPACARPAVRFVAQGYKLQQFP